MTRKRPPVVGNPASASVGIFLGDFHNAARPANDHINLGVFNVIDFDNVINFRLPQRVLSDWSEDALAEAFAERQGSRFLYHTEQRRWYRRGYSETGEPQWQPDTTLEIESAIRGFLRETAEALAPRVSGIRMRLGSAGTLFGVKRLAQCEFAGDDDDLEMGAS
jgi:hypothetical protein